MLGWSLFGAMLLAVALLLLSLLVEPQPQWTLLNGAKATLVKTSYGTEHHYAGQGWTSWLGWLPDAVRNRLNLPGGMRLKLGQTNLVLWIQYEAGAGRRYDRELHFVDTNGYATANGSSRMSRTLPDQSQVLAHGFAAFPRRQPHLHLRMMERGDDYRMQDLGTLTVRNPAYGEYPQWTPDALPATFHTNEMEWRLVDLVAGVSNQDDLQPPRHAGDVHVAATFEVRIDGQLVSHWVPVGLRMSDATGNEVSPHSWSTRHEAHQHTMYFQGSPWTDESAWRIRAEFSRSEQFAPGELWRVDQLEIMPDDSYTNRAVVTQIEDTSLSLLAFWSSDRNPDRLEVRVRTDPARENYRLSLIEAKDPSGDLIKSGSSRRGGEEYGFMFRTEEPFENLSVLLAWHRSRFAEFLVRPRLFRAEEQEGEAAAAEK